LITVPADQPVFVIAVNTTSGDRGSGFISLEYEPGKGFLWSWVNSPDPTGALKLSGGTSSTNTNMLTIDQGGLVTLRVADADHLVVRNNNPWFAEDGYVWIMAP
jgi:hypothetical protein